MEDGQLYETYKPLLFSVAYRLTGSVTEAEDVVQETFLAWSERSRRAEAEAVSSIKSYLCRIASNLCADRIKRNARQRELYTGPWLPEPLVEGAGAPEEAFFRKESVTTAYLLLLQQLTPVERIVFVLREAFAFGYDEIAEVTGKSPANCRQIFARARRGMPGASDSAAMPAAPEAAEAQLLLVQFVKSVESGDISRIVQLLSTDAVLLSDGGGKVRAAIHPIRTAERVAAFIAGVAAKVAPGTETAFRTVNGMPGIVFSQGGLVWSVLSFAMEEGRIAGVYLMMNPDKLAYLNATKTG